MTGPNYYRTIIVVEVLTEGEPYTFKGYEDLAYTVTDGHASGDVIHESTLEVTEEQMSKLLTAQGSDPDFLIIPAEAPNEAQTAT